MGFKQTKLLEKSGLYH